MAISKISARKGPEAKMGSLQCCKLRNTLTHHLVIEATLCGMAYARGQPEQVLMPLDKGQDASDPVAGGRPFHQLCKSMPRHILHLHSIPSGLSFQLSRTPPLITAAMSVTLHLVLMHHWE